MRPAVPDLHVGLPLLVMWLVTVVLIVAGYLIYRRWRRKHPKVVPRETSYSEKLQQRLAKRQDDGANAKGPRERSAGRRRQTRGGR